MCLSFLPSAYAASFQNSSQWTWWVTLSVFLILHATCLYHLLIFPFVSCFLHLDVFGRDGYPLWQVFEIVFLPGSHLSLTWCIYDSGFQKARALSYSGANKQGSSWLSAGSQHMADAQIQNNLVCTSQNCERILKTDHRFWKMTIVSVFRKFWKFCSL